MAVGRTVVLKKSFSERFEDDGINNNISLLKQKDHCGNDLSVLEQIVLWAYSNLAKH